MIPAVCSRYYQDKYKNGADNCDDDDYESIEDFILPHFIGKNEEQLLLVLLDSKGKRIFCDVVSRGTTSASDVNVKKILQLSVQHKSSGAILAHNHPSGSTMPSPNDIDVTIKIKKSLAAVGVHLLEHYIVGDMKCSPMSQKKGCEDIFY